MLDEPQTSAAASTAHVGPPSKMRRLIAIGVFGLVVWFGIGVPATVGLIGLARQAAPDRIVAVYLSEVQHGRIEAAQRLSHQQRLADEPLLTDKAYAHATDRITGFTVLDSSVTGSTARVRASIAQPSGTTMTTFELDRGVWSPLSLLGIDRWRLESADLSTITTTLGAPGRISATIAGVDLGWKGVTMVLHAFPGDYTLKVAGTGPFFTLPGGSTDVRGFGEHETLKPAAQLTESGTLAIVAAAKTWLSDCLRSTDLRPSGCSFHLNGAVPTGEVWTNRRWTLITSPMIRVSAWDFACRSPMQASFSAGGCWDVTSSPAGAATFHADYRDATGGSGAINSVAPITVEVQGMATSFTGGRALFRSVDWQ